MAKDFDDFSFDDGTDDGFGNIGETQDDDTSSDFGDFGGQVQTANEVSSGKSTVVKQSIIIVIISIIVLILAFMIVQWLTGGTKKSDTDKVDTTPPVSSNAEVTPPVQPVQNEAIGNWKKFSEADGLTFNEEYISSIFTVTTINHCLNVVDSEKNLMVKTVITGTLSGFIGTYEMEIPYSKGCRLSIGNYFNVEVQVGNSNEKTVVGEINY